VVFQIAVIASLQSTTVTLVISQIGPAKPKAARNGCAEFLRLAVTGEVEKPFSAKAKASIIQGVIEAALAIGTVLSGREREKHI